MTRTIQDKQAEAIWREVKKFRDAAFRDWKQECRKGGSPGWFVSAVDYRTGRKGYCDCGVCPPALDLVEEGIQERLDEIDPLTGDQKAEVESEVREDWSPSGELELEDAAGPSSEHDEQYLGYVEDETGAVDGDQLEVAIDNGLVRAGPAVDALEDELNTGANPVVPAVLPELTVDDLVPTAGSSPAELGPAEPELPAPELAGGDAPVLLDLHLAEERATKAALIDESSVVAASAAAELETDNAEYPTYAHIVSIQGRAACTGKRAPSHAREVTPTLDQKCPKCVAWEKDCDHELVMQVQDEMVREPPSAEQPTAPELMTAEPDLPGPTEQQTDELELAAQPGVADPTAESTVDESTAQIEAPELDITKPELAIVPEAAAGPQLGSDEQELDGQSTEVEPDATQEEAGVVAEPELEVDEPTSWLSGKAQKIKGRIDDKVQFAKAWISELRSGRHKQCHGAWQETGVWGGTKQCTIRVAENEFGVSVEDIRSAYGSEFVNEVLSRNDPQRQPFDKIATFIEREQLEGEERGR